MKVKTLVIGVCMSLGFSSFGQHVPTDPPTENTEKSSVQMFAPNAFTPDGDYYNDTWKIYIEGIDVYDFHLSVFDRGGQLIWESFNAIGEWDGYYGGSPAPDGVYGWVMEAGDATTDEKHQFTGFITVLR